MKRVLTAVAVSITVAASIAPASAVVVKDEGHHVPPTMAERHLAWAQQHIKQLVQVNAHLHRFIAHLRDQIPPPVPTPAPTLQQASATTTTPATASYSGGVLSADQVASYARGAGFPESVIPTMVAYASRESGYDPGAINSASGACGLWQAYPCSGGSAWLDPAVNAQVAYAKFKECGLGPWHIPPYC